MVLALELMDRLRSCRPFLLRHRQSRRMLEVRQTRRHLSMKAEDLRTMTMTTFDLRLWEKMEENREDLHSHWQMKEEMKQEDHREDLHSR